MWSRIPIPSTALPHGLADLVARSLAHDPTHRPTAVEFLECVSQLCKDGGGLLSGGAAGGEPTLAPEPEPEVIRLTRNFPIKSMAERQYDVFINHAQHSGQDQAGKLKLLLEKAGLIVWYDMSAEDLTAKGMEGGVHDSCVGIERD